MDPEVLTCDESIRKGPKDVVISTLCAPDVDCVMSLRVKHVVGVGDGITRTDIEPLYIYSPVNLTASHAGGRILKQRKKTYERVLMLIDFFRLNVFLTECDS